MLEPTIVVARKTVDSAAASRLNVGTETTGTDAALDASTCILLRQRLIILSISLLVIVGLFTCLSLLVASLATFEWIVRTICVAGLCAILALLTKERDHTISELRLLEIAILAVPISELILILVYQTHSASATGQFEDIVALRPIIGMATCMTITVYGMFVPNRWQRAAVVTGTIACLPTVSIVIQTFLNKDLQSAEAMRVDIAAPVFLITAFTSGIATLGAHVVHGIRREIESARQYGQYRLEEEIGSGAMGVVYKSSHRLLKRPAAIKLIRPDAATDTNAIKMFEKEVQVSATLSHWNTVQIYDYGRTQAGEFYYVMEYLEGESLAALLSRKQRLCTAATIRIVRQICNGLEEAHARGMVHRDLKPANIFLTSAITEHEVVKILDFGLAVHATSPDVSHSISGTPNYMSPEQINGEAIDGRSDIYSIGCILFECLAGSPPFAADSVTAVLNGQLTALPPTTRLPAETSGLTKVIERCLSKKPAQRYTDVSSLRQHLESLLD